ncbi:MAG: hypothetical protein ACXVRK_03570 [Gaiellaceae bacterium]
MSSRRLYFCARHSALPARLIPRGADGRQLQGRFYAKRGAVADPIYVYAKVGIVDDAWVTLGSANLNDHSLFNDTAVNLSGSILG